MGVLNLYKIRDIISKIELLSISLDEYSRYEKLLMLPKTIYIAVLDAILNGRLSIYDLDPIITGIRKKVAPSIHKDFPQEKTTLELIKDKLNGTLGFTITEIDLSKEKEWVSKELAKIGINISENDREDIFITHETTEKITLNYDDIKLSTAELEEAIMNGLTEVEAKKAKLLKNYLKLSKTY
jgi:hypothetical protein